MIRNAILGLFLLVLAFPAVAHLCHQDMPPAAEDCHQMAPAHHDAPDEPEPAAKAQHICIGCVAPTKTMRAPDAVMLPGIAYAPTPLTTMVSADALPAIPPPKS